MEDTTSYGKAQLAAFCPFKVAIDKHQIRGEAQHNLTNAFINVLKQWMDTEKELEALKQANLMIDSEPLSPQTMVKHEVDQQAKDILALSISLYAKTEVGGETLGLYAACRDGNLVLVKRFATKTKDYEVGLLGAYQGGNTEVIEYMKSLVK